LGFEVWDLKLGIDCEGLNGNLLFVRGTTVEGLVRHQGSGLIRRIRGLGIDRGVAD
jgi:hypothetical protein